MTRKTIFDGDNNNTPEMLQTQLEDARKQIHEMDEALRAIMRQLLALQLLAGRVLDANEKSTPRRL